MTLGVALICAMIGATLVVIYVYVRDMERNMTPAERKEMEDEINSTWL